MMTAAEFLRDYYAKGDAQKSVELPYPSGLFFLPDGFSLLRSKPMPIPFDGEKLAKWRTELAEKAAQVKLLREQYLHQQRQYQSAYDRCQELTRDINTMVFGEVPNYQP